MVGCLEKEIRMDRKIPGIFQELLADLTFEELEPRLELQIFVDPMTLLAQANQNQNNGQQQNNEQNHFATREN